MVLSGYACDEPSRPTMLIGECGGFFWLPMITSNSASEVPERIQISSRILELPENKCESRTFDYELMEKKKPVAKAQKRGRFIVGMPPG